MVMYNVVLFCVSINLSKIEQLHMGPHACYLNLPNLFVVDKGTIYLKESQANVPCQTLQVPFLYFGRQRKDIFCMQPRDLNRAAEVLLNAVVQG